MFKALTPRAQEFESYNANQDTNSNSKSNSNLKFWSTHFYTFQFKDQIQNQQEMWEELTHLLSSSQEAIHEVVLLPMRLMIIASHWGEGNDLVSLVEEFSGAKVSHWCSSIEDAHAYTLCRKYILSTPVRLKLSSDYLGYSFSRGGLRGSGLELKLPPPSLSKIDNEFGGSFKDWIAAPFSGEHLSVIEKAIKRRRPVWTLRSSRRKIPIKKPVASAKYNTESTSVPILPIGFKKVGAQR